jgi:hypothetical protein
LAFSDHPDDVKRGLSTEREKDGQMRPYGLHSGAITVRCLAVGAIALVLAACGGGGGGGSGASSAPLEVPSEPTPVNRAPELTGIPPATAQVNAAYAFHPGAWDADGDTLSFQISNRPAWASFDPVSGSLTGTPANDNIGTNSNIVISVSDGTTSVSLPAFYIQVQAAPQTNLPPVISGSPPTSALAGQAYSFQPSASDPNGNALTFSISNKPAWAIFSTTTGRLNGTPTPSDVGTYANIVIRVSDGTSMVALAAFSITVTQVTNGAATISWIPPTQNTDGSPLTDLAGYRIYYGTSPSNLDQMVELSNPGLTSYVVENLAPATWYFTMVSLSIDDTESEPSGIASKRIL